MYVKYIRQLEQRKCVSIQISYKKINIFSIEYCNQYFYIDTYIIFVNLYHSYARPFPSYAIDTITDF